METTNIVDFTRRDKMTDALTELLRTGAQDLIVQAVEAELSGYMAQFAQMRTEAGHAAVVRNGYHPERPFQTGIGPVNVRIPKVRSKDGTPVTFRSALVPPYVRRTKTLEAALPWLYPHSSRDWLLGGAGGTLSACLVCFDADVAAGRDSYLRSEWRLAGYVACPTHREMLRDRCPVCSGLLRIPFRLRNDVLRPFCRKCASLLTSRGGEAAGLSGAEFGAGVLGIQRQAGWIVRGNGECRVRLEHAIRTLWAPLDRVDAARPVLALWFDQPGWHCPFEARAAVGKSAPLQHLPVRWRALTLVILQDLFGSGLVFTTAIPEVAHDMFRRAVPVRPRRQSRASGIGKEKNPVDVAIGRVQRLSKSPVHRLSGNFLDERADFGPIHP